MITLMLVSLAFKSDIPVRHFTRVLPAIHLLTGDVVLRDSKGIFSSVFKNISQKEKKYSHVGFILKERDTIFVAHYIDEGKSNGLKLETWNDFVNANKCNSIGIYRFSLSKSQFSKLDQIIHSSLQTPLPFDDHFDLSTDNNYYCTEWISKSLWQAASFKLPVTEIAGMNFITPDNIYMNSFCRKIDEIVFRKTD